MSAYAFFGGAHVISCRISLPWYGAWTADVVFALPTGFSSLTQPLVVGDLQLFGYIERLVSFSGSRSARVVGGFGGWQQVVKAKAYNLSSGIPLSLPLADVAKEVGEQWGIGSAQAGIKGQTDLQAYATASIGTAYVREAGPASRVLRQLAGFAGGGGWWIDGTGATRLAPRSTAPVASAFEVISWGGGKGQYTIATETLSDWAPGRTFTNPVLGSTFSVGYSSIEMDNDGQLRLTVLQTP